ncbi:hypothetical protein, partial [Marinobacter antarcticus]|uniref:hypothetical protein n=1 Tax=Marinobacter antarcticus TaxID=564117 RepID=UPI0026EB8322
HCEKRKHKKRNRLTHRDRSEYKTHSSVMAVCKSVTIPGMTGHVRRNTHIFSFGSGGCVNIQMLVSQSSRNGSVYGLLIGR